mgnify:CR=1 FL=1
MLVGVPQEIKPKEFRVGLTPASVKELTSHGHTVYVQSGAGEGSSFSNEAYRDAGAEILQDIEAVYQASEMIVKVKEPVEQEYNLINPDHLIFTYFHFASNQKLTQAMMDTGAVCLTYETVEDKNGKLPLLDPMSEVAGRMAIQEGAQFLEKPNHGRGILLGGVPGVKPANVVILGGGTVGYQAAKMAAGLEAQVTIMDINLERLRYLSDIMPGNVSTQKSNQQNIEDALREADLLISAVLIPGAKTPHLVTREMLNDMKRGAVVVDVAVDQGGAIETCKPTTHDDPIYEVNGVIHYCVANMPGAVPITSTTALNNVTLPYVIKLADKGWWQATSEDAALKKGLNVVHGNITYQAVSNTFDLPYREVNEVLALHE